jgi:hypothetical protein
VSGLKRRLGIAFRGLVNPAAMVICGLKSLAANTLVKFARRTKVPD